MKDNGTNTSSVMLPIRRPLFLKMISLQETCKSCGYTITKMFSLLIDEASLFNDGLHYRAFVAFFSNNTFLLLRPSKYAKVDGKRPKNVTDIYYTDLKNDLNDYYPEKSEDDVDVFLIYNGITKTFRWRWYFQPEWCFLHGPACKKDKYLSWFDRRILPLTDDYMNDVPEKCRNVYKAVLENI